MIWHIFRKDWCLLRPLVIGLILAELAAASVDIILGTSHEPAALLLLSHLMPNVVCLGIVMVTIVLIQQDNLLSDRQDWLVRPIRRRDLLLAKLAFIGLLVQGPLMLVDSLESLMLGFSPSDSIAAALSHGLVTLCVLTLPAFLLASTTRTVAGALSFAVVLIVVYAIGYAVAVSAAVVDYLTGALQSRLAWTAFVPACVLFLSAFGAIAVFQYTARRALVARGLAVAVATAALVILMLSPWQPSFAIQRWFDSTPGADRSIALAFAPERLAGATTDSGQLVSDGQTPVAPRLPRPAGMPPRWNLGPTVTILHLPIRIDGLPEGAMVIADRALLRLDSADGRVLYQGDRECAHTGQGIGTICSWSGFVARQLPPAGRVSRVEEAVSLPTALFEQLKRERVRVTIDYMLTLLEKSATQYMHAVNDSQTLRDFGSCTTRIDRDEDGIELHCIGVAHGATCVRLTLEDPRTQQRNPEIHGCPSDYAPLPINLPPTLLARFGIDVPFLDRDGTAHFPVSTSQLPQARLILDAYEPRVHFARRLVIPDVQLGDWASSRPPTH